MEAQPMDIVTISLPRDGDFRTVAGLVVGGVAARHDVTLDALDDIQLALDSLLDRLEADSGEVTIKLRIADDAIDLAVGPVDDETVSELEQEPGGDLGLRRLLDTTVDEVSVTTEAGERWVGLHKSYALAGAEG
jgi:anti-sigma regulatory factor (Ser/Thr protein kinase)